MPWHYRQLRHVYIYIYIYTGPKDENTIAASQQRPLSPGKYVDMYIYIYIYIHIQYNYTHTHNIDAKYHV